MKVLIEIISPLLALIVVVGGLLLIYFEPSVKTEIIGLIVIILSYYFGSSKGSQNKDEVIAKSIGRV